MNTRVYRRDWGFKARVGIRGVALVERVAARYCLTPASLKRDTVIRRIAIPRQHAMSDLRAAGYSEAAIAEYFGRERSTVSHADQRHLARLAWADVLIAMVPDRIDLSEAA